MVASTIVGCLNLFAAFLQHFHKSFFLFFWTGTLQHYIVYLLFELFVVAPQPFFFPLSATSTNFQMNQVPETPARVLVNFFFSLSALLSALIFSTMSLQFFMASKPLSNGFLATQVGDAGRGWAAGKIRLRLEGTSSLALPDIVRWYLEMRLITAWSDNYNV